MQQLLAALFALGSFIAQHNATIPKRLEINQPCMLIRDFSDGFSEGGRFHNFKPIQRREDEIIDWRRRSNTRDGR